MRKLLALLALGACGMTSTTACVPAPAPPPASGVILYGDSLIQEALPYLDNAEVHAWGGTAICDWTLQIIQRVNEVHPRAVVLSFWGNTLFTECMYGYETPDQIRAKYAADMAALKEHVHVPILWVLNPMTRDRGEPVPNPLYAAEPWHVDAGAAVEGPNGEFLPEYRLDDGLHLNDEGARRFGDAIDAAL